MSFEDVIALRRVDDQSWDAAIPEGWDFMGIANGGLVSSVMVTALAAATGRPDPITSTAHFLRPAVPGTVTIDTAIIRTGRSLTTARAQLAQNDTLIAHLVSSLGELEEPVEDPIVAVDLPMPPPVDKCLGTTATPGFEPPPIAHRLNLHLNPAHAGFTRGEAGEPVMSGWAYIPFDAPTTMMPVVCDAMPPPFFNTGKYIGPLPTVELTVHTYARPTSDEPVAALFRTDHAGPRYLEEDGWIRSADGRLIAVSRQIAVLPR